MKKYFITGTDTGIGKTNVTIALIDYCKSLGYTTLGIKPLASGCHQTSAGLRNDDALQLQQASSITLPYEQINPIALEPPIAPHLVAKDLSVAKLIASCGMSMPNNADVIFIEGVGGWLVPLNKKETMADFVKTLYLPVILVVGIRLGCLSHSLLTQQAILQQQVPFYGWIANCLDPDCIEQDAIIQTLTEQLHAPLLGVVGYQSNITKFDLDFNLNDEA